MTKRPSLKRRPFFNQSGTSLLELMSAMAAGLVVVGSILQSLSYFQHQFLNQQAHLIQAQDVRLSLELLAQELHLASVGSLVVAERDCIEFTANIHGLMTNVTAPGVVGETTLAVEDGRGWQDNKLVRACWHEQCDAFTLARAGQRSLLVFVEPMPRPIPAGAAVTVSNRVRYYTRADERGTLRFLRQLDGGASALAGPVESVLFSYRDAQGRKTTNPGLVQRVIIEVALPHRAVKGMREIALRT